jgi:hypothetical protein
MRRVAVTGLVLLIAAVALLAAGCGGDEASATSAEEWADEFCTAVSDWREELEQIGEGIDDPSTLSIDALEEAADDASAATDEFIEEVRALGAPDTESGEEVEQSVESLADTAEAEKEDVDEAVDDVSNISDLPSALSTIGESLTAMATALQRTLDAIENGDVGDEIRTAFQESEACDEL